MRASYSTESGPHWQESRNLSEASTHSDIIDAAALHKITFTGFKSGEDQLCAD